MRLTKTNLANLYTIAQYRNYKLLTFFSVKLLLKCTYD